MLIKLTISMVGGGLILLSIALAFFSVTGATEVLKILYIAALASVIALGLSVNYFNVTFDGIFLYESNTPKNAFYMVAIALIVYYSLNIHSIGSEKGYGNLLASGTLSILMLWYGFCVLFGTFFAGKRIALFFYSPIIFIFHRIRMK